MCRDGWRPQRWRYRWNAQSQLSEFITPDGARWRYAYDPFGRRIRKEKLSDSPPATRPVGWEYQWSGDQLIAETPLYADGTAAYEESIHWLYAPGGLIPLARQEKGRLHYVVSDHLGTPRELLTEQGKRAWAGRLNIWGWCRQWAVAANDADKLSCNLRFAGQYEDEESGLHYNRFRYYDTETGQYLTPDPTGLAGGVNPYGYVANPLKYSDPFGLCKVDGARARQAQMLEDNVGYNISPKNWDQYPALGQYGTFVTDKQGALKYFPGVQNSEVTISKSLAATIEKEMGLSPRSLIDGFNIRRIDGISSMQPRSPLGGNDYFLGPGQHLPGGAP